MAGTHLDLNKPHLMTAFMDEWPCRSWTFKTLADLLGNQKFSCRAAEKSCDQKMETQCSYHDVTIQEFCDWLDGTAGDRNPLRLVPKEENCCYIDYKYMKDMFKEHPHVFDEVQWEDFGLVGYNGYDSTIWISSEGANTPAHQDTYGFNLVTQIYGRKLWILFPPEDSEYLYPTRIPYEESSIFTEVNVRRPDLHSHPRFKRSHPYVVTLQPGQTLYVPRHWWHFVESLEPSISINVWIPVKEDVDSRFSEAITRCLATGLISSLDTSSDGHKRLRWLNTTESLAPTAVNLVLLKASLGQLLEDPQCLGVEEKEDGSGDSVCRHELLQYKDLSHGIIQGDLSHGFSQGDCSQELKQSDTSLGITDDLSHVIIDGDLSCRLNQGDCPQDLKQSDLSHETTLGDFSHETKQSDISHETQGDISHETSQSDLSHEIVNHGGFQHGLIQQGGFLSEKEAKTAAYSQSHSQCKGDIDVRVYQNVQDSPRDELNALNSQTPADRSEGASERSMLSLFIGKMEGYEIRNVDSPFQCDIDISLLLTEEFDSQASSPKKTTAFDSRASSPKKTTAFDSRASSPKKAKLDTTVAQAPSDSEKNLTQAPSSRIISINPCLFDTYLRFLFSLCRQIQCRRCFLESGATDYVTISSADRNNFSSCPDRNNFCTHTRATGSGVSECKSSTSSTSRFETADGSNISCLKGEFNGVSGCRKRKTSCDCKGEESREASGDSSGSEENGESAGDSESVDSGSLAAADPGELSESEVADILLSCTLHPRVVELISQLFREQCKRRLN